MVGEVKEALPSRRILFLQLPCLDNESGRKMENLSTAALYLLHSLKRVWGTRGLVARFLEREEELLDDSHLLRILLDFRPDIVCCTLYLWNVERTLHILRVAKKANPMLKMILGGPEIDFIILFYLKALCRMWWW